MGKFEKILFTCALVVVVFVASLFFINVLYTVKTAPKIIETFQYLEPQKPSYNYLKSITVYINGKRSDGLPWGGTGSIVKIDKDYTYILTNAHVAGQDKKDVVLFVDNGLSKKEAKLVKYHEYLDLAVIKVKGTLHGKRAVKGITSGYPQEEVYLVGHHLGRPYIYGEGVFSGYDGIDDLIQIPCLFGNSGSAVCNKYGELVSVVRALNFVPPNYGLDVAHALAINGLSVELFLKELNVL